MICDGGAEKSWLPCCPDTYSYPLLLHCLVPVANRSLSQLLPPNMLTSHLSPVFKRDKAPADRAEDGVQIPSGGKTQWALRGWQQLCREHQCLPVAGKGTQSGPCSAQPLASWGEMCWHGWWGSWWRRERKGRKLLQGKNRKQKEGIAGGRLPKVAESRLVQLTTPYSVQTVPEQHPWI